MAWVFAKFHMQATTAASQQQQQHCSNNSSIAAPLLQHCSAAATASQHCSSSIAAAAALQVPAMLALLALLAFGAWVALLVLLLWVAFAVLVAFVALLGFSCSVHLLGSPLVFPGWVSSPPPPSTAVPGHFSIEGFILFSACFCFTWRHVCINVMCFFQLQTLATVSELSNAEGYFFLENAFHGGVFR